MKLEVLASQPKGPARPVPLLFVHGAYSCARIWEVFFQPFFAAQGYASYALSLRGHGGSAGREQLWTTRLRDYVQDVKQVVTHLGRPPVLIGTSMGGLVVQHYLRHNPVAATVLMASGPPHGMIPSTLWMIATNPLLIRDMTLMSVLGPGAATVDTARRALFRPETPAQYIRRHLPQAQPESALAMLDVMAFDLPPSRQKSGAPILVLGAERDAFVTTAAVQETARCFGVGAEIFPRMPHAMMLDEDWELVAKRILAWLGQVLPAGGAKAA